MDDHVVHMKEIRKAYTILVGEPEGKKPFGRTIILKWVLNKC
jgi:hypothetical protein